MDKETKGQLNKLSKDTLLSFTANRDPEIKTLPKAQRTRGLSSYYKITVQGPQILNILQFQNLD